MGQLNNLYVSSSFQGLLKMTDSTNGVTNTLQTVQTGDGGNTALQVSMDAVNISGSLTINGSPISVDTGSFATTGSNIFTGKQTITGSNGTLIYDGTISSPNLTLAEVHTDNDSPWLERFYNDSFSTSSSVMSYFGWNDGRFIFHNDSTQSIAISVDGYYNDNLLVGNTNTTSNNDFIVSGSIKTDGHIEWNNSAFNYINSPSGALYFSALSGGTVHINDDGGEGDVFIGWGPNNTHIRGNTSVTGSIDITGDYYINGVPFNGGTSGSSGTSGSNGSDGTSGSNGTDGTSGSNGTDGTSGSNGSDGTSGTSGTSGSNGSNGSDGTSGTSGSNGSDGTSGDSIFAQTGSFWATSKNLQVTGSLNVSGITNLLGDTIHTGSLTNVGDLYILTPANNSGSVKFNITGSSPVSQSNIIMASAGPTAANLTGSVVISGSNNIIFNGNRTSTVGSYGYIGGSNIVGTIPTLNTSSLVSPIIANNQLNGALILTFITSSVLNPPSIATSLLYGTTTINHSSGSLTFNGNINNSNLTSTANTTTLSFNSQINNNIFGNNATVLNHNSSSILYSNNIGGGMIVTNNYTSSVSTLVNNVSVSANIFGGTLNQLVVSGSNTSNRRTFTNNLVLGGFNLINSISSGSSAGHLVATSILGDNLIVSGSNTGTTAGGSVFIGRFNATGSLQESSQDTVFAVGTGTSSEARRNSLRIDNSGNTAITGSLGISGTTNITGSLSVSGSLNVKGDINSTNIVNSITGRTMIYGGNGATGATPRLFISGSDGANTTIGRSFYTVDTTMVNGLNGGMAVYAAPDTSPNINIGVYTPNTFDDDYELLIIASTGGTQFQDFDNFNTFNYQDFLVIPPNIGNNPAPQFTRGLGVTGSLVVSGGLYYSSGSNTTMGTVALNGGNPGVATVSNSLVTSNSLIFLTKQTNTNGGEGTVSVTSKGTGTFSITSNHNGDADVVAYQIINPA